MNHNRNLAYAFICTLSGIAVWSRVPILSLGGATALVLMPGFLAWRIISGDSSVRNLVSIPIATLLSFAIVPLWINITSLLFGFHRTTVFLELLVLNTVLILWSSRRISRRHSDCFPRFNVENRVWITIVANALFISVLVILTYAPIYTYKGLPPVMIGDWSKHGAVIWALMETGVPPQNKFLGVSPPDRLTYYYYFHLISATIGLLSNDTIDLRWIFIIPSAILSFSTIIAFFFLSYLLLNNDKKAIGATLFLIWVGGLDLVVIASNIYASHGDITSIRTVLRYSHIDSWMNLSGLRINVFYVYFVWVPQHLAALSIIIISWILWIYPKCRRNAHIWIPVLFGSIVGMSAYVALVAVSGTIVWASAEILRTWIARNSMSTKRLVVSIKREHVTAILLSVLLSSPMIILYWTGRSPGRGILLGPPSMGNLEDGAFFSSMQPDIIWLRILDIPIHYFIEVGAGSVIVILSVRYISDIVRDKVIWRWILTVMATSFVLASFFRSSGVSQVIRHMGYGTNNDLSMRTIMPFQAVTAILFGLVWYGNARKYNGILVVFVRFLIILGVMATTWEMVNMAFIKYTNNSVSQISYWELDALTYVRTHTSPDTRFQQSNGARRENYLIARRWPAVFGTDALSMTSDQPRFWRIYKIVNEVYGTKDSARAAHLLNEIGVDLVFVRPQDLRPVGVAPQFDNTQYFRLVFDNGIYRIYELNTGRKHVQSMITYFAKAKMAEMNGNKRNVRYMYNIALSHKDNNYKRFYILMNWGVFERFHCSSEKALKLFDQALAIWPQDINAHANRGAVLLNLRQYEPAMREFQYILSKEPRHYWATYLLAAAYERSAQPQAALQTYVQAASVARNSKELMNAVTAAVRMAVKMRRCGLAKTLRDRYAHQLASKEKSIDSLLSSCIGR